MKAPVNGARSSHLLELMVREGVVNINQVAKAILHLQGSRAPVSMLRESLPASLFWDLHSIIPACTGSGLVDVVVWQLAMRGINNL